jgi:hypothetical protein
VMLPLQPLKSRAFQVDALNQLVLMRGTVRRAQSPLMDALRLRRSRERHAPCAPKGRQQQQAGVSECLPPLALSAAS